MIQFGIDTIVEDMIHDIQSKRSFLHHFVELLTAFKETPTEYYHDLLNRNLLIMYQHEYLPKEAVEALKMKLKKTQLLRKLEVKNDQKLML
jgi:hypothetical protein